jgi:hypothetical protein
MSGSEGVHVFRNAEDSHEVIFLIKWDSIGDARNFLYAVNQVADDSRKIRDKAGVADESKIYLLDEEEELEH